MIVYRWPLTLRPTAATPIDAVPTCIVMGHDHAICQLNWIRRL